MTRQWCVVNDRSLTFNLSLEIYNIDVVTRSAHEFVDIAFVHIGVPVEGIVDVRFDLKNPETNAAEIAGSFSNTLLDHSVRQRVRDETRLVRELIVAQAFAEADLLRTTDRDADYNDDPAGITVSR